MTMLEAKPELRKEGIAAVTTMTGLQARLVRTALNRPVRELAKLCDVSTKTLQRIELDDPLVKIVTVRKVQRAGEALRRQHKDTSAN
jgi:ribosomal 50S subunit-associated protein YjgA (DUF615 family)